MVNIFHTKFLHLFSSTIVAALVLASLVVKTWTWSIHNKQYWSIQEGIHRNCNCSAFILAVVLSDTGNEQPAEPRAFLHFLLSQSFWLIVLCLPVSCCVFISQTVYWLSVKEMDEYWLICLYCFWGYVWFLKSLQRKTWRIGRTHSKSIRYNMFLF